MFCFVVGALLSYFVIFPLTFRFLGTYQVSGEVENLISLESYISTLLMLCLMMGVMFEIPVVCWLLAKFGIINASWMSAHRRRTEILRVVWVSLSCRVVWLLRVMVCRAMWVA